MKKWSSVSGYSGVNYTPELLYIQNIRMRNKDRKIVFTVRRAVNSYDSMERHFRQTDDGFLKKQWSGYSSFSNCTCSNRRWVLQRIAEFSPAGAPKAKSIQPKVLLFLLYLLCSEQNSRSWRLLKTPTLKSLITIVHEFATRLVKEALSLPCQALPFCQKWNPVHMHLYTNVCVCSDKPSSLW